MPTLQLHQVEHQVMPCIYSTTSCIVCYSQPVVLTSSIHCYDYIYEIILNYAHEDLLSELQSKFYTK